MIQRNDLYPQMMAKLEAVGMQNEPVKLIGIRDESNQAGDVLNDYFLNCFDDKNVFLSLGTTDPGIHAYASHPEGAAHMCLGPHKKIWVIGTHAKSNPSFAHEALCSRSDRGCEPIKYWRDRNKDFIYSTGDDIQADPNAGINMHRASKISDVKTIGLYSEGCQVRVHAPDHEEMMAAIKKVPAVAATHFIGTNQRRFWQEEPGKDYWSYLFSYLLTPLSDWRIYP